VSASRRFRLQEPEPQPKPESAREPKPLGLRHARLFRARVHKLWRSSRSQKSVKSSPFYFTRRPFAVLTRLWQTTMAVAVVAAVHRRACAMCSMPLLRLPFRDNGTSHLHCPTSDQLGTYCRRMGGEGEPFASAASSVKQLNAMTSLPAARPAATAARGAQIRVPGRSMLVVPMLFCVVCGWRRRTRGRATCWLAFRASRARYTFACIYVALYLYKIRLH
jgi:RNase P subunit RPR2